MITIKELILFLKDLQLCSKSPNINKDADLAYLAHGSNVLSVSKQ